MRATLTLVLLSMSVAVAHAQPVVVVEPEQGRGILRLMPAILHDPAVARELRSGLTNTVVVKVSASPEHGAEVLGGARIEIRYEPWDEVYLTRSVGIDGELHEASLDSDDALQSWWSELELCVLPAGDLDGSSGWMLDVEATVLPFSSSEQHEAQVWFTRTVADAETERPGTAPVGGHARVLDVLVATSIRRPALMTYHWKAQVEEAEGATKDLD